MIRPGLAPTTVAALRQSDRRIVVTGAGGWLGSATIELLHQALGDALPARLHCFGSSARTLTLRDGLTVEQRPLAGIADLPPAPTIVLHLAFLTKDRVEGMDADAYARANAALSATVLDALDAIGATAVFVASSGAARSADNPNAAHDMRLYGALKVRDEQDFAAWAERTGRTAVIARVFNVAGPYINKHGAYALAAFVLDALAGRAIAVRAPHRVVRGYVSIRELMSLVLALLLEEGGVTRFDTGGDPMELGEVARAVDATLGGAGVSGGVERAAVTSDRVDHYVGNRSEYDRLLGARGIAAVPFAEQVRETADYLVAVARRRG